MIRVLLVDDDYLARMYLKQLIDWQAEGFELVGDVSNGQEAMEQLEALKPDIILTDISMPVMDGVQLISLVKKQDYPARIAVLSCHDEFSFVKEAMRLGADEYILKNTLDEGTLRELLYVLKTDVEQSFKKRQEREKLINLAEQGSRSVRRALLQHLREEAVPLYKQREILKEHGIENTFYQCAAVLIQKADLDSCAAYAEGYPVQCFDDAFGACYLLLDFTGYASMSEQQELLEQLTVKLCAGAEAQGKTPFVAASGLCTGDGGLYQALLQAETASKYGFFGKQLCYFSSLPPFAACLPEETELARQQVQAGDGAAFLEYYEKALKQLAQKPAEPKLVLKWIGKLDELCGRLELAAPESLEQCRLRAAYYQRFLSEQGNALQVENPVVAKAIEYIEKHFQEPISLQQVADAVHLNATYLSFVFKRESGVNFSEYLLSCRLEEVKRRLSQTSLPIKDIAAGAGFVDYRHFCKLFKKETGMRPADFRRQP